MDASTNAVAIRQVVTANRLRDGTPVYYAGAGAWSAAIDAARAVASDGAEALLAEAKAGPLPLPVIDPYLIEAAARDEGEPRLTPLSLRERIRAFGPTVRPAAG